MPPVVTKDQLLSPHVSCGDREESLLDAETLRADELLLDVHEREERIRREGAHVARREEHRHVHAALVARLALAQKADDGVILKLIC